MDRTLRDLAVWFSGVVVGALLVATGYYLGKRSVTTPTPPRAGPSATAEPIPVSLEKTDTKIRKNGLADPDFWVPIVEKVGPAVVNIDGGSQRSPFPTNAGSGIIIDGRRGIVVTNSHVVEGAGSLTVTLKDGRSFQATILGSEPHLDLAVLKIKGGALPEARFGPSGDLKEGSWVLAIGNPYGFSNTATVGIVSAKGRNLQDDETFLNDLIQTDAAINPGNSGGALVNVRGEVVGLNVAMRPGAQGIAFAIPAEIVKDAVDQLLRHQEVRQPFLGIQYDMASADEISQIGMGVQKALKVVGVAESTPAEKAGLTVGDFIITINGQPVRDLQHLRQVVRESAKNRTPFPVTIYRNGQTRTLYLQPAYIALSRLMKFNR